MNGMPSGRSVDLMIKAWKIARLSSGEHVLGYPRTNVLHPTHGVGVAARAPELGLTDAQKVQEVVDLMHEAMRSAFEAYHLGIIRGDNARMLPQRARAVILGIPWSTYRARCQAGWRYVQRNVEA